MPHQTYIRRRGAVYGVRVALPLELVRARAAAGLKVRREVWKSLGTKDQKLAHSIGPTVVDRIKAEFDRDLDGLVGGRPDVADHTTRKHKPTDAEMQSLAYSFLQRDLHVDAADRDRDPTADQRDELLKRAHAKAKEAAAGVEDRNRAAVAAIAASLEEIVELERKSGRMEKLREERDAISTEHPTDLYAPLAEEIIRAMSWDVSPKSPQFARLCTLLRDFRLRTLLAMERRDVGDFTSTEATPAEPAKVLPIAAVKPGESLLELFNRYLDDKGKGLAPETKATKRTAVQLFSQFIGPKGAVATVTRGDFRDFKLMLKDFPRTAQNQKVFKGKTFVEIVKINRQLKATLIADKTINNYLSALGSFFNWLADHEYHATPNLTHGMHVVIDPRESRRESYSEDELKRIFSLPVFTGTASLEKATRPGPLQVNDWRFWIPVICLYFGARLGEIAQLRVEDIKKVGGHWSFHITDEGAGQRVKTKGSVRLVPIHPELIRLGFLKYHKRVADAGASQLFPELEPNEHGRLGGPVSRWWRKYLARFDIEGNVYRFRHTFTDALRRAGHLNEEIAPLLGHQEGSMTERYGNLQQITIDRRASIVASATFPVALTPR